METRVEQLPVKKKRLLYRAYVTAHTRKYVLPHVGVAKNSKQRYN